MNQSIASESSEMRILAVAITKDMRGRLTRLAKANDISMAQIVKTAVDDYLRARKIE